MEPGPHTARAAAEWAGYELTPHQASQLAAYVGWLSSEAIPAGGLGPREGSRLWTRHVADALVFAVGWTEFPEKLLDVGSGVGLPGIPLAVLWPEAEVVVLDRGGRRIRLVERAIRLLELRNVSPLHADVSALSNRWPAVVARGSVPALEWPETAAGVLERQGTAVFGLSRRRVPPPETNEVLRRARVHGLHPELVDIPAAILDGPAWLLIMGGCSGG